MALRYLQPGACWLRAHSRQCSTDVVGGTLTGDVQHLVEGGHSLHAGCRVRLSLKFSHLAPHLPSRGIRGSLCSGQVTGYKSLSLQPLINWFLAPTSPPSSWTGKKILSSWDKDWGGNENIFNWKLIGNIPGNVKRHLRHLVKLSGWQEFWLWLESPPLTW